MIHVDQMPIDIEEQREWILGYKAEKNIGWDKLGQEIGEPAGTLQPFCKGTYTGAQARIEAMARSIFKFRQGLISRDQINQSIPVDPGYFETPTALLIRELLAVAHSGKITVGAFAPGLGKTVTSRDFLGRVSPVTMVTLDGISGTKGGLIRILGEAIGSRQNWLTGINHDIVQHFKRSRGLLIVDEANHATLDAIEQLRSLHDTTGVGICLLGNEELLTKITSGISFARLKRRIRRSVVQQMPVEGDVTAFCDAWGISDHGIRKVLLDQVMKGDSGGLGECEQIVSDAAVLAAEDGGKLQIAHIKWAIQRRRIEIIRS